MSDVHDDFFLDDDFDEDAFLDMFALEEKFRKEELL